MTDLERVRDALEWHEYGNQDERRRLAFLELDAHLKEDAEREDDLEQFKAWAEFEAAENDRLREQLQVAESYLQDRQCGCPDECTKGHYYCRCDDMSHIALHWSGPDTDDPPDDSRRRAVREHVRGSRGKHLRPGTV